MAKNKSNKKYKVTLNEEEIRILLAGLNYAGLFEETGHLVWYAEAQDDSDAYWYLTRVWKLVSKLKKSGYKKPDYGNFGSFERAVKLCRRYIKHEYKTHGVLHLLKDEKK